MDIKIVQNSRLLSGQYLKGDYVLETVQEESEYENIPKSRLFLYHVKDNIKEEIAPNLPKYHIGGIYNINKNSDYIYFLSILEDKKMDGKKEFLLVRYHIFERTEETIYFFEDDIEQYRFHCQIKCFVFDDAYLLLQKAVRTWNISKTYSGFFQYDLKLCNLEDGTVCEVQDENLNKNGIDSMYAVSDTMAVLKNGFSLLPDCRYNIFEKEEVSVESISLINIRQFVSDLMIEKSNITLDVIDQAFYNRTFPYVFVSGEYVTYSAVNLETKEEEVCFVHCDTRESKTCINQNVIRMTDLASPFVIDNTPYLLMSAEKENNFVNLNTRNTDFSFSDNLTLQTVENHFVILTGKELKGFIKKTEVPFFEVYAMPREKLLLKEKGEYLFSIYTENDELYVFEK